MSKARDLANLLSGSATLTGATVIGDIVVTGNVDGRDVAADGAKLDGIESGATADPGVAVVTTAPTTAEALNKPVGFVWLIV